MQTPHEKLTAMLLAETTILKAQYLQKVKEWAIKDRLFIIKQLKEYYAPTPEHLSDVGYGMGNNISPEAREYRRRQNYLMEQKRKGDWDRIARSTEEAHVTRQVTDAEIHYVASIAKLAARILKKGLNTENITVKTAEIGVNIETVITDGAGKTVRAWTIVASGDVQRPHYRYLIK